MAADHDQIVFSGFAEDAFYWRGGGANADLVGDLQAAQGSRGFLEMGAGEEARFGRFRGDVERRDGSVAPRKRASRPPMCTSILPGSPARVQIRMRSISGRSPFAISTADRAAPGRR